MEKRKSLFLILILPVFGFVVWQALSVYDNWNYFDHKTFEKLKYEGQNMIVITPRLTEAAYSDHAFYWYYDYRCGTECLSVSIDAKGESSRYGAYNYNTIRILQELKYPMLNDAEIHHLLTEQPKYLDKYDTIILLHNEYVTQELYDAITGHDNVVYLHPNALYAKIEINHNNMTLIRGHGYPTSDVDNGFGWVYDNTRPDEFDLKCESWKFKKISNGHQLNCYPEVVLTTKPEILAKLKTFIIQ